MTVQAASWSGEFGDAYTRRNRVDWQARIPFWRRLLIETGARSVYELGCNAGWNLSAIRRAFPDTWCHGCDLNAQAWCEAKSAGLDVQWVGDGKELAKPAHGVDLSFTCGVLIHVPPAQLEPTMKRLIEFSNRWVMAIEYYAPVETEIEYRGQPAMLWKRPFGRLYEGLGLKLLQQWDAGAGFDNCRAWLMEKTDGR